MKKTNSSSVSIYALGGLGEVGKNMYCFETENSIVIIDAGVRFPGVELPGIDYIVPDYTHLKNNRNKIKALIITHGHEDHIGGIPFLLQTVLIPIIYAPRLAAAMIRNKLEDYRMGQKANIVEYDSDSVFEVEDFKISFFRVTHSIPDSFGVVLDTSEGRIVSTGDFKVDLTPIGPDIELNKMAKLGSEGVDLLLSDSTNSETEGYTPSEKNVLNSIEEIFDIAPGRLIVSTFSSNISRIQQICNVAAEHKRKIVILGRSMERTVELSRNFGYIKILDTQIIEPDEMKQYKLNEIVILCTGSQGEPMAALSRIATGEHKDVKIFPGDTVVFSSSAIPGNGISISRVVNTLTRCGADVITNSILSDIHSSGHPGKQELRLVLKIFKPKYFMPMHGEYRMLRTHAEIACTVGLSEDRCFILDNGDSLILNNHKITKGFAVEHGSTYIDGKDVNGLAESVIDDRKTLTEEGMLAVCVAIDTRNNQLLIPPTFYVKGLVYQSSQEILDKCKEIVEINVRRLLAGHTNFAELKNVMRNVAGDYLFKQTHRRPMVIPIIMSKS